MQPASAQSLFDALVGTRDPDAQRALIETNPAGVSIGLIEQLASRIRDCLRKDPELGETLARSCWVLAGRIGTPLGWAYANRSRALVFANLRKCADAEPFFETSAALFGTAGAVRELARTRIAQAENLTYTGDYARAQGLAKEAQRLFRKHGDRDDLARVHIFAGNLLNRLNRYTEALAEYDRARRVLGDSGDKMVVAALEMNRASPLVELNRFDEALESLETARDYCNRHAITLWADILDRNIARLYRTLGRYSDALRSLNRPRPGYRERGDVRRLALCDLASAEIYLHLNLYREAHELGQRALDTFREHSNRFEAAQCLSVIGVAQLESGDPGARASFLGALEAFREEGNAVHVASMNLRLGRLEMSAGNHAVAGELARLARDAFEAAGLTVLGAYAQLIEARTLCARQQDDEAAEEARSALGKLSGYGARWVSYQCRDLLATLHAGRGERREAERLYLEALEDIESLRGKLDLDEFRASFGRDKYQVYDNLAALRIDSGDTRGAFCLVERSKSRTLIDLLENATGSVWQSPVGGERQDAVRKLRQELNGLYSRLAGPGTAAGSRAARTIQEDIRQREREVVELLREAASQREPWARLETRPAPEVSDVQEMLSEDETLVEYCTIRGHYCAFVVDRKGFTFLADLAPVAEVARSLKGLGFQLSKFHLSSDYLVHRQDLLIDSVRYHLRGLYEMLMAPLESHIAGKSLAIVPHGIAHYIPFQALYDGGGYLIDRHDVVYGASAAVLRICREKPERPGTHDLVLAVPDEHTPAILEEAQVLGGLLPGARVFVGEAARADLLAEYAASAGRLHIAAHGVFRSDNPLFSSLKLGDSWLNMVDVFNLTLGSDLTTLSACETGMSALCGGDELMGLTQAFLYAGTPSLVVSLWRVNDRSTTLFMKRFYEALLGGVRKPEALRLAALEVREQYPHPYYWAPFVLLGKS